ncbi:MmgE/PrpD family protein [Desulfocastanea catecholica]
MDATFLFAKNFKQIKYEDLPGKVVDITKKQILDYFGVALGGSSKPGVKELLELSIEWGGAPQSSVLCWGNRLPAPMAAQLNATMAHTLDYDDVHEAAIMHPGVVAIPTALAMAEFLGGVDGKELIAAIALGTDFICRLGLATRPGENIIPYGWHQTSLYGYITSAAIAGRMLGLTEEQIVSAVGIAYHQTAGNAQCVSDGVLTKRMGPGFAVRGGIASAFMSQKGITGAQNCLEGLFGLYKVYHDNCYSREELVEDLGSRFETLNVSIKPYPCCRGVHPFIDAAMSLVNTHDILPKNIESVEMFCGNGTWGLLCSPVEIKAKPRNFVDSQFSAPWGVATVLVKRRAGLDDFTPEAIKDPAVLDVAGKISVEIDPDLTRGDDIEPGRVKVILKDGNVYSQQVNQPTGSPEKPLTLEHCERKFRDCLLQQVEKPMPKENADRLVKMVSGLEKLGNVKSLMDVVVW